MLIHLFFYKHTHTGADSNQWKHRGGIMSVEAQGRIKVSGGTGADSSQWRHTGEFKSVEAEGRTQVSGGAEEDCCGGPQPDENELN